MTNKYLVIWGILWRSHNRLDGTTRHIMRQGRFPHMFRTKQEAQSFIRQEYGYIAKRRDLRVEPHGWRMPVPVGLNISAEATP